jgi:flagellar hook-length control protein FliK
MVSKNKECVMYGSRDPKSRLWRVDLKQKFEKQEVQCNHSHDNNNQKDLVNYLHAACFSTVKSTWITAIKNEKLSSWPGLTEHAVEKHLSKSAATTKGHLNRQRQNTRTTKIKSTKAINQETDIDHGIKTQFLYAATIDAGQIYTDQTGRFPVVSSRGKK